LHDASSKHSVVCVREREREREKKFRELGPFQHSTLNEKYFIKISPRRLWSLVVLSNCILFTLVIKMNKKKRKEKYLSVCVVHDILLTVRFRNGGVSEAIKYLK
jgi:hypothetical protein